MRRSSRMRPCRIRSGDRAAHHAERVAGRLLPASDAGALPGDGFLAHPRDQAVHRRRFRRARGDVEFRDHHGAARARRSRQGADAADARGEFHHPPRPAADRHPAQARHDQGRPHDRLRMRGGAARRRLCRLRHHHHSLCRRAVARHLRHPGGQIRRLPRLRQSAALRRHARARLGQHAPRLRMSGRPHGARTRARSVRRAPRQPAARADAHHERPDREQLRARRMSRQGRARERLA